MKTRILLITFTFTLMLMLSGCDAILEAFYPEFGPDNNSIFLTVEIDSKLSGTPDLSTPSGNNYIDDFSDYPVVAALIPLKEDGSFDRANIFVHEPQFALYEWDFGMIPHGKYSIVVWYDSWDTDPDGNLVSSQCRINKPDWDVTIINDQDREPVVWAHLPGNEDDTEFILDADEPVHKEAIVKLGRIENSILNVNPDDLEALFPY